MSIFDKWNQVQPKEVSGPQKGYMVLNKSRTQELNRTRKTLIDRLNVVKSRLVYLVQNDDTED